MSFSFPTTVHDAGGGEMGRSDGDFCRILDFFQFSFEGSWALYRERQRESQLERESFKKKMKFFLSFLAFIVQPKRCVLAAPNPQQIHAQPRVRPCSNRVTRAIIPVLLIKGKIVILKISMEIFVVNFRI